MRKFFLLIFHHRRYPVQLDVDNTDEGNTDQNKNDGKIFLQAVNIWNGMRTGRRRFGTNLLNNFPSD